MVNVANREITCTLCGHSERYSNTIYFFDVIERAKEKGWQAYRNNNAVWIHACPECCLDFVIEAY